MSAREVVTVDGLAASGKSSIARELARELGYVHISTGLLYRAVGWLALRNGVSIDSEDELAVLTEQHAVELCVNEAGESAVSIDGDVRGTELASGDVSMAASAAARFPKVRRALFTAQRDAFPGRGLVAEGRDMGTVIFPDAAVKFFVNADVDVRAVRRHAQLNDSTVTVQEIRDEIIRRDHQDSSRETAPTVAAPGSVHIDNSKRSLSEVVNEMAEIVRKEMS